MFLTWSSLAAVSHFLRTLPRIPAPVAFGPSATALAFPSRDPRSPEIENLTVSLPFRSSRKRSQQDGQDGELKGKPTVLEALSHAAILENTPVRVGTVPQGLNADEATWLPRTDYQR